MRIHKSYSFSQQTWCNLNYLWKKKKNLKETQLAEFLKRTGLEKSPQLNSIHCWGHTNRTLVLLAIFPYYSVFFQNVTVSNNMASSSLNSLEIFNEISTFSRRSAMFQSLLKGNQYLLALTALSAFINCYFVFGPHSNNFYPLFHLDLAEVTLAFFLLSFNFYSWKTLHCLFQILCFSTVVLYLRILSCKSFSSDKFFFPHYYSWVFV